MERRGFIRPRGPGSISHLPRRKIGQDAPAPVLTTQKERDEKIAALFNEVTLEEQQAEKPARQNTQGEQAKPATDEEITE